MKMFAVIAIIVVAGGSISAQNPEFGSPRSRPDWAKAKPNLREFRIEGLRLLRSGSFKLVDGQENQLNPESNSWPYFLWELQDGDYKLTRKGGDAGFKNRLRIGIPNDDGYSMKTVLCEIDNRSVQDSVVFRIPKGDRATQVIRIESQSEQGEWKQAMAQEKTSAAGITWSQEDGVDTDYNDLIVSLEKTR